MKIIVLSDSIPTKTRKEKEKKDETHIFSQFFIHQDDVQNKEIQFSLEENLNNFTVSKIHLLNFNFHSN